MRDYNYYKSEKKRKVSEWWHRWGGLIFIGCVALVIYLINELAK